MRLLAEILRIRHGCCVCANGNVFRIATRPFAPDNIDKKSKETSNNNDNKLLRP